MRLRSLAGLAAVGIGGWLLNAAVLTPRQFRLYDVPLAVPDWPTELDGLRIAVLGDLHAGSPWVDVARAHAVVDAVVAAQPDVILLLGDHLADVTFGTHVEPGELARALAGLLRADVPVVGVLGNHDWYAGGWRVRAALEEVGLPVLEESAVPVLDGTLWIAGVGDLWERSPSVERALADVPAGAPTVLLTHNPDVVDDVPASVHLVLAGHTHGGQVAVRGRPLHRLSERSANRWTGGWYADQRMFITAGVGTSLIPLRSVTPEVPVLVVSRLLALNG